MIEGKKALNVNANEISFSVFTKPWKTLSVSELGKLIRGFGFDGIEFPLREGYQLEPEHADQLPRLAQQLNDHGLQIFSVTGSTEERVFAGCAEAGIPIIRIMPRMSLKEGYLKSEQQVREQLELLLPLCEKYRVKIGVQHHYGNYIVDSMGLLHLIEDLDPKSIGAIWDSAHDALAGQQPEFGLDIVWSHLCMVNLKNAYYERINGPEAEQAEWKRFYTSGRQGMASWPRAAEYLKKRDFKGIVCLTAEYSTENDLARLIKEDITYAKSLLK